MDSALPVEVLQQILNRLTKDDVLLLDCLSKNKNINAHTAMDKTSIIREVKGLTDFKFQISSARLELACLINKTTISKSNRFYINASGLTILNMYKKSVAEAFNVMKEIKES